MTDTQRSLNAAMRKQVSAGRTDRQSADSVQGAYYAVLLVAVPSWESAPDPASNPADAMSFFTSVSPGFPAAIPIQPAIVLETSRPGEVRSRVQGSARGMPCDTSLLASAP